MRAFHPPTMWAFHPFATRASGPPATRAFGQPAIRVFGPTAAKPSTRLIHNFSEIRTNHASHSKLSPAGHLETNEKKIKGDPDATEGDDIEQVGVSLLSVMI